MKRFTLLFVFSVLTTLLFAQLNGDGYYRVKNDNTKRYVVVRSNKAEINYSTNNVDLGSLQSILGFENIVSDPSSVIYIEKKPEGYVLKSQGTDTYSMIGYYVKIVKSPTVTGAYRAYATASGLVKYIADEPWDGEEGTLMSNAETTKDWYIIPVTSEDEQYFGMKPEISTGNDYYLSFYASFPFSFQSEAMNAYYVTKVDVNKGVAYCKELVGEIPASTPIIVKSLSGECSKNKLNLLNSTTSISPSDNLLTGVYFNNGKKKIENRVAYDKTTMRILGKLSDGSIGFVTSDIDYIPANHCYLNVPANAPAELRLSFSEPEDVMYGDANGDGSVNVTDVTMVVNFIMQNPIDNFDKEAADANQNGEINVADITVIVDKIMNAGIESSN